MNTFNQFVHMEKLRNINIYDSNNNSLSCICKQLNRLSINDRAASAAKQTIANDMVQIICTFGKRHRQDKYYFATQAC